MMEQINIEPAPTVVGTVSEPRIYSQAPSFDSRGLSMFRDRVKDIIEPNTTAKETISKMVKAALEVEFGTGFSLSPGFPKMVSKIADSIITNPDLRRQALSVATQYCEKGVNRVGH